MIGTNSDQCKFSSTSEGPSSSSNVLCSSQPKMDCPLPSSEPSVRPSVGDRPVIPPRNYQNPKENPPSTPYNAYNRFPYGNQRFPFNSYSYGYGSSLPYYSGYNSMYGGGAYGINNGNYMNNGNGSRFIRAAEESTRPTFEAIESLTRAINSIAFMMESTFGSLNMSFQAILSVIDNFSQARAFLKQFFASILTFRIFHKFFSILINLMRKMNIISDNSVANLSWLNTSSTVENSVASRVSMWPIFTFLGLMFGAPYLISRMIPREDVPESKTEWDPNTDKYVPLVAVHDFQAGTAQEISFQRGQKLKMIPPEIMQPTSPYWIYVADESNHTGFVPRNHVAPV